MLIGAEFNELTLTEVHNCVNEVVCGGQYLVTFLVTVTKLLFGKSNRICN